MEIENGSMIFTEAEVALTGLESPMPLVDAQEALEIVRMAAEKARREAMDAGMSPFMSEKGKARDLSERAAKLTQLLSPITNAVVEYEMGRLEEDLNGPSPGGN